MRVGVAGLGACGLPLCQKLLQNAIPNITLQSVAANNLIKAKNNLPNFTGLMTNNLEELCENTDIVIECLPPQFFSDIAYPVVESGIDFVAVSCGALVQHMDLIDLAKKTGSKIYVPSGALGGLDAVQGACEGNVERIQIKTMKPPAGLQNSKYVIEKQLDLMNLKEPMMIFQGTAREAIAAFPANVNVSVALSLAGLGVDQTFVEIWADPFRTKNTHQIYIKSDATEMEIQIQGVPSPINAATGMLTHQSVLSLLRKITNPLKVGT